MPSVAEQVEEKISYGLVDWVVTRAEQAEVVRLLRNDAKISATLSELRTRGSLVLLLRRVVELDLKRSLFDVLATGADSTTADAIRRELNNIEVEVAVGPGGATAATISEQLWQIRFNVVRLGVPTGGATFDETPFRSVIPADPALPFSGQGATGIRPDSRSIPLTDQFSLWRREQPVTARYSNPLPGDLSAYLASLSMTDRRLQAQLLLKRPITTIMPDVWGPTPPSRADVIKVAARQYRHEAALVAAFLLSEQRDQSGLEDAKDYISAASITSHNASLGLGQVVVSTATRNRLFSDLISDETLRQSSHSKTARLLTDDAINIFAVAKYLRILADAGTRKTLSSLPNTQSAFPTLNLSLYGIPFAALPADNIRALGSEYTSAPWDDRVSAGWGYFVYEAYRDVKTAGVL